MGLGPSHVNVALSLPIPVNVSPVYSEIVSSEKADSVPCHETSLTREKHAVSAIAFLT